MKYTKRTLIVLAHPRDSSLTYQIKESFAKGLEASNHQVDTLDLYKINFNPVLTQEDEPKWLEETQKYSEEVHQKMDHIRKYDSIVFAFPLYWSGMPAIMKGYFDRVLNYSLAYGPGSEFNPERVLFLAVAGATQERMEKHGSREAISTVFQNMLAFCGIQKSKTKFFFDTVDSNPNAKEHISDAYEEGLNFDKW